ncbi:hypothetical protein Pcinc_034440 [Petrolisthes cinctipes]|uniref:Immunoglobulin I-set domain-containing protein n=1 Tax=Petrolisthes cinctipes TaxID=88211 RepID=A0AAE1JXC2_PETCI|nr:hypothetical protein Pcinc_034440 [Petrolisthes cinctipes]
MREPEDLSNESGRVSEASKERRRAWVFVECGGRDRAGGAGERQRFRVKPESVEVKEGEDVFLECAVEHQQGKAQWTKDGFALAGLAQRVKCKGTNSDLRLGRSHSAEKSNVSRFCPPSIRVHLPWFS